MKYEEQRDGISVQICNEDGKFVEFFKSFVRKRNLVETTHDKIDSLSGNKLITEAQLDEQTLVFHLYICDGKIARLLYSATRIDEVVAKSVVGRTNRFLRYEDIRYFKEHGYETYDLAGYAKDMQDSKLQRINAFKESFGGKVVEEYSYYSSLYRVALKFTNME